MIDAGALQCLNIGSFVIDYTAINMRGNVFSTCSVLFNKDDIFALRHELVSYLETDNTGTKDDNMH